MIFLKHKRIKQKITKAYIILIVQHDILVILLFFFLPKQKYIIIKMCKGYPQPLYKIQRKFTTSQPTIIPTYQANNHVALTLLYTYCIYNNAVLCTLQYVPSNIPWDSWKEKEKLFNSLDNHAHDLNITNSKTHSEFNRN